MRDPVDIDLNRYLDEQEAAIEEEEQAEQDLYRDRLQFAMRYFATKKAMLLTKQALSALVEGEIEETIENL